MITFEEFQATKTTIIDPKEMADYLDNNGMGESVDITAIHKYDAGEQGTGYIEQYGDYIIVNIENAGTDGMLEECEKYLYKFLSPMA